MYCYTPTYYFDTEPQKTGAIKNLTCKKSGKKARRDFKYKYNGKELFTDNGLDWLDYGARFYDATTARWWVQDPKAEKYSSLTPYNYVAGNPVGLVDPDGMSAEDSDEKSDFQQWFEAWKEEKDARSTSFQQRSARAELEMIQAIAAAEAAANEADPDDPPKGTIVPANKESKIYADFLRNSPLSPLFLTNPFYKAEAIYVDGGINLSGGEGDVGFVYILTGKDKGVIIIYGETAGGISFDAGTQIEIGRIDYYGNKNKFTAEMVYGERNKVWLSIGEGLTMGGAVAISQEHYYNKIIISQSVSVGLGLDLDLLPIGWNKGEIKPLKK